MVFKLLGGVGNVVTLHFRTLLELAAYSCISQLKSLELFKTLDVFNSCDLWGLRFACTGGGKELLPSLEHFLFP